MEPDFGTVSAGEVPATSDAGSIGVFPELVRQGMCKNPVTRIRSEPETGGTTNFRSRLVLLQNRGILSRLASRTSFFLIPSRRSLVASQQRKKRSHGSFPGFRATEEI